MSNPRWRTRTLLGVLVAVVMGGLVPAGAAAAPAQRSFPAAGSTLPTAPQHEASPLQEFRTADNGGTFYTLDPSEAQRAQRVNGFRPTGEAKGISLYDAPGPGMIALHRLRVRSGDQSYMVARADSAERRDGRFVDEGALGYAYERQQPGTMSLHRYSRDGEWRLARADRADLLAAGFHDDGITGWVPRG